MPMFLTIVLTKLILKASRLLGRGGGSALPGLVAERLDSGIGRKLAARIPRGSIIITGTNGKTTTGKLLAAVLADNGEHLVQNRAGSNLSRGVVSALIEHIGPNGQFKETMGLFEVDEAAMPAVARLLQPKTIVVLNLFRDQLDRYGELDTTAALIGRGITAAPGASLNLNADDPLVAGLAQYATDNEHVFYFGLSDAPANQLAGDVTADSDTCPVCGRPLHYDKTFYGHIGHYACIQKHFQRPRPQISAAITKLTDSGVDFTVTFEKTRHQGSIKLPGIYNAYNALAALSVAAQRNLPLIPAIFSVDHVKAAFGRVEKLEVDGKSIALLLVKNPTGFNQIIQTFLMKNKQQSALFIINDNFADGRDVSWLWDVAFEELGAHHHRLYTGGIRATDMALRLKYADLPTDGISPDITQALNQFIDQLPEGVTGYIIPTYTAMLETRKVLGKRTKISGVWE